MKKVVRVGSSIFIWTSILGLASVAGLTWFDPQATMDLVHIQLENNDARSSMRGIFGGVGFSVVIGVAALQRINKLWSLYFLSMFWGLYATSRAITIVVDGPLGEFGTQWIYTETLFCVIGLILARSYKSIEVTD